MFSKSKPYRRNNYISHKGQILQSKPLTARERDGWAILPTEYERAVTVIKAYGQNIVGKSITIPDTDTFIKYHAYQSGPSAAKTINLRTSYFDLKDIAGGIPANSVSSFNLYYRIYNINLLTQNSLADNLKITSLPSWSKNIRSRKFFNFNITRRRSK